MKSRMETKSMKSISLKTTHQAMNRMPSKSSMATKSTSQIDYFPGMRYKSGIAAATAAKMKKEMKSIFKVEIEKKMNLPKITL